MVVTLVEFPTLLLFEWASVFWETRGWHEWRILLRQRENYWGSRTVGASCGVTVLLLLLLLSTFVKRWIARPQKRMWQYVTVLGSAAYIGARYLVRVRRGSRRDLTRLRRLLWRPASCGGGRWRSAELRGGRGDACSVLRGQPSGPDIRRFLVCVELGLQ